VISHLQLASEKQAKSHLTYQLLVGREKGRVLVPMGEPLRRLCARLARATLKCNTQRAGLLVTFGVWEVGTIRFRLLCWGRRFTTFIFR
jgi:hypothetical protein